MPIEFGENVLENDDFVVETDGNGDLVQRHKQTGAEFKFDSSENAWYPVEGMTLNGGDITNANEVQSETLRGFNSSYPAIGTDEFATFSENTGNISDGTTETFDLFDAQGDVLFARVFIVCDTSSGNKQFAEYQLAHLSNNDGAIDSVTTVGSGKTNVTGFTFNMSANTLQIDVNYQGGLGSEAKYYIFGFAGAKSR